MSLQVFVSHSSNDADIAEALVELLERSLGLPSAAIRCTSVNGYRLPAGASTSETLRREVREAGAFIGLITPESIRSAYVLFELGARWGAELPFIPVLARGADSTTLQGPLTGFNALDCGSAEQMHQVIQELGRSLSVPVSSPASYGKALRSLVTVATRASASAGAIGDRLPRGFGQSFLVDCQRFLRKYFQR
jgi:hypothetical protein